MSKTKTETLPEIEGDLIEQNGSAPALDLTIPYPQPEEQMVVPGGVQHQSAQSTQIDRLVEMAITSNADMDKLERLLELKQRYDAEEQRKDFTAAMAKFKAEGLVINKDQTVKFPHKDGDGKTEYRHASLGNIIGLATPLMARHGLSHHWERQREEDRIKVRCVITHKNGHREIGDWWDGPPDTTGKKNSLQQGSSTTSYLERYTFLAATGLATVDMDDDGRASGDPAPEVKRISEEEALQIHAMITDNDIDMDGVLNWLSKVHKVRGINDIPLALHADVTSKIQRAIARKAKEAEA